MSLRPPLLHRRRLARAALAAATAVLAAAAIGTTALRAVASVPAADSGWGLVWQDDFTGTANTLPSTSNWIIDTGTAYSGGPATWGTGEVETYTASTTNLGLDGSGNLRITPVRDSAGNWTSGRIETVRSDFKPATGTVLRMEGRIQMPSATGTAGLGYWSAFWALGAPYRGNYQNWPGVGEFDIMENVNGADAVWGTLHCGTNPGGPCNETVGLGAKSTCPSSACPGVFHTYRFEWDNTTAGANQLRWYVDGQQFHTVNQTDVTAAAWSTMTSHAGYFLLLNVAVGGSFPDAVAGSTTPTSATTSGSSMLVDYVAVWQSGASATPSASSSATASPTPSASSSSGATSAYGTIQAEGYASQSGTQTETCSEGGQDIGYIANGDWALYRSVDFGSTPATQFLARAASGASGGVSGLVQVRLDSRTATPVGSFAIGNTGGWQSWRTVPANIAAVTGTHDVYLTFTSGQPADFVNLNWFTFGH